MLAVGIMSIVAALSVQVFQFISMASRNIEASANSQQETILWMSSIRKHFYVSLYDKLAPPSKPQLTRVEHLIAGNKAVTYSVKLDNAAEIPTTIFKIDNQCVDAPLTLAKLLPKMDREYLAQVMDKLKALPECRTDLTPLDCEPGQTIFAHYSGPNNKLPNFPILPKQAGSSSKASAAAVVGMVCVYKNTADYTFVQMMFGTIDQRQQKPENLASSIKWDIRKMILPPPSNGNSQYVR
jgi:hypothetical protein